MCLCDVIYALSIIPRGGSKGGLWGLETPLHSESYSKVNASINYFTDTV